MYDNKYAATTKDNQPLKAVAMETAVGSLQRSYTWATISGIQAKRKKERDQKTEK
jgi:hypothetical protein